MKICFVLPKYQRRPVGGYKMVYEYANRLVAQGHKVCILHMNSYIREHYHRFPESAVRLLAAVMTKTEPRWFPLDRRVRKYSDMDRRDVAQAKRSDVVVATAVETVEYAFRMSETAKKVYLIQGYEAWGGYTDQQVTDTYKTQSVKIVIAAWLKDIVDQYSPEPSVLIQNPIDLDKYREKVPVLKRDRYCVGVLYHPSKNKGFQIAYRVLCELKEACPKLTVVMFGGDRPDFELPEWVHFTYNASQDQTIKIYNQCRTFLCASVQEGFGLTGYEAMACGCVLVSTKYEGIKEYAVDQYNALLAPVNDVKSLKQLLQTAIQDDELAGRLSRCGRESLQEFSWDKAMKKFNRAVRC